MPMYSEAPINLKTCPALLVNKCLFILLDTWDNILEKNIFIQLMSGFLEKWFSLSYLLMYPSEELNIIPFINFEPSIGLLTILSN